MFLDNQRGPTPLTTADGAAFQCKECQLIKEFKPPEAGSTRQGRPMGERNKDGRTQPPSLPRTLENPRDPPSPFDPICVELISP